MQLLAAPGSRSVSFCTLKGGWICMSTGRSACAITVIERWPWSALRRRGGGGVRGISSASPVASREGHEVQKFDVKCGSAGSITVDIHNITALNNPSSPFIIHLPPTGSHLRSTHPKLPSYLLTPETTLASINYRWNIPTPGTRSSPRPLSSNPTYAHHPFPIPLHDALTGYTFLLATILPRFSPPSPQSPDSNPLARQSIYGPTRPLPIQRPILIYGSFLGGTLATSLALTESFTSRSLPSKIVGLITKNAVFDWTDIASSLPPEEPEDLALETGSGSGRSNGDEGWDANTIHELKRHLFTTPSSAFDSFASPTLFFRTSGLAIPQTWPKTPSPLTSSPTSPSPSLSASPSETEDHWPNEAFNLSQPQNQTNFTEIDLLKRISQLSLSQPPSRPTHLKFPPSSSTLKIPFSLFLYSSSPSTSYPSPPTSTSTSKSKPHSKLKKKGQNASHDTISAAGQAQTMAALMRRSVFTHELSERKVWDEDLDPEGASEARVRVEIVSRGEGRQERDVVRGWVDEMAG